MLKKLLSMITTTITTIDKILRGESQREIVSENLTEYRIINLPFTDHTVSGNVLPAVGEYILYEGTSMAFKMVPNSGYSFEYWELTDFDVMIGGGHEPKKLYANPVIITAGGVQPIYNSTYKTWWIRAVLKKVE